MTAATTLDTASRKVGFYGCSGGVVRLSASQPVQGQQLWVEGCPCCGHSHTVRPFWRRYMQVLDLGRPAIDMDRSQGAFFEGGHIHSGELAHA